MTYDPENKKVLTVSLPEYINISICLYLYPYCFEINKKKPISSVLIKHSCFPPLQSYQSSIRRIKNCHYKCTASPQLLSAKIIIHRQHSSSEDTYIFMHNYVCLNMSWKSKLLFFCQWKSQPHSQKSPKNFLK